MEIRNMQIDDYDSVYAIWLSCPGMGLNNLDDSREGIAKYLSRNPNTCFVAVERLLIGAILTGHDVVEANTVTQQYLPPISGKVLAHNW